MLKQMGLMLLLTLGLACSNKDKPEDDNIPTKLKQKDKSAPTNVGTGVVPPLVQPQDTKLLDDPKNDEEKTSVIGENKGFPEPIAGGGDGPGTEEPPPGPPQPPPAQPQNVPTPPKYETEWTFYNYCLIAENIGYAEQFAGDFESQEHFESWLGDIQYTVFVIRDVLKVAPDLSDVPAGCSKAYRAFQQVSGLVLRNRNIVNIDPIAGVFPRLQTLDLAENKVVNMTFLRNLPFLVNLDLSRNEIPVVPFMVQLDDQDPSKLTPCGRARDPSTNIGAAMPAVATPTFSVGVPQQDGSVKNVTVKVTRSTVPCGLYSLNMLNIEEQSYKPADPKTNLDLVGLQILPLFTKPLEGTGGGLKTVRANNNIVNPAGLRGHHLDLWVSNLDTFSFKKGDPACDQGPMVYPTMLENYRAQYCR